MKGNVEIWELQFYTVDLIISRLIEYFMKHDGVEFVTMEEMADEFRRKNPAPQGALMPAEAGKIFK